MATLIEPCPFCDSHYLHISNRLLSHAVICESCKSSGPHRRDTKSAVQEWNQTSKLLRQARTQRAPELHGRLHELEDAVRNIASALRHTERQIDYDHS